MNQNSVFCIIVRVELFIFRNLTTQGDNMTLTDDAKTLAGYLAYAWESGIVEPYFELIDATAGNAKTIQVAAGLGVLKEDEFDLPPFALLMELAGYLDGELVRVSERTTTHGGRKWTVQLGERLRTSQDVNEKPHGNEETIGPGQLPNFFISYKSYEKRIVEQLAGYLRRIFGPDKVWFDEGIYAGQRWWNEIISQLERSDFLIYVVTNEALASVYCRAEFTEAWRLGKQVISVLMRGARLPSVLTEFQYVHLPNGEMTPDSLVEIFATVVQRKDNVS